MRNRMLWGMVVSLLGCLLILVACVDNPLPAELDSAERTWRAAEIDDYIIEVAHMRSTWHFQTHTVTVRGGEVVASSATCVTAPAEGAISGECEVEPFDPVAYTVPGLFATARALAEAHAPPVLQIDFQETYGYPTRIRFDLPDVVDEDQLWRVESFDTLN